MKFRFRVHVLIEADAPVDAKTIEAYVREAIDGWSGGGENDVTRSIKVVGDIDLVHVLNGDSVFFEAAHEAARMAAPRARLRDMRALEADLDLRRKNRERQKMLDKIVELETEKDSLQPDYSDGSRWVQLVAEIINLRAEFCRKFL